MSAFVTDAQRASWTSAVLGPRWAAIAAACALALLAGAHAFERFGGLEPCALCLRQREVLWAALSVAGLTLFARRSWPWLPSQRVGGALLGVVFLVGAIVAAYHAGVEWKFWPGPATCSAAGGGPLSAASVLQGLGGGQRIVPCDEAPWRMFGLSMAGYNAMFSFCLAGLSALSAILAGREEPALE